MKPVPHVNGFGRRRGNETLKFRPAFSRKSQSLLTSSPTKKQRRERRRRYVKALAGELAQRLDKNPILIQTDSAHLVAQYEAARPVSPKWRRLRSKMLARFAKTFPGKLSTLTGAALEDWLSSLTRLDGRLVCVRTRKNYFLVISALLEFARTRGNLPRDNDLLSSIQFPKNLRPAPVQLYTADEMAALLSKAESTKAGRKLVPLIVCDGFLGVRHGEINEEGKTDVVHWENFDWARGKLKITQWVSKTHSARVIDLPANVIAWLRPYKRPSGVICSLKNSWCALCRLRKRSGIAGKRRNALRKTFITYKMDLLQNADAVAHQAGTSPGIIRQNYDNPDARTSEEAQKYFALHPLREEELPLFAWKNTERGINAASSSGGTERGCGEAQPQQFGPERGCGKAQPQNP